MFCRSTLLALSTLLLLVPTARAGGKSGVNFVINASVPSFCKISTSVTSINFGVYYPIGTININGLSNSTALVTTICNLGSPNVTVSLSSLNNPSAIDGTGLLKNSNNSSTVTYRLWQNAGHTVPWGSGTNALLISTNVSSSTNTIYATIAPGQSSSTIGNYSDTVTALVKY